METINTGNISSVVISVNPSNIGRFISFLKNQVDVCEYHLHDEKGRVIVTIEGSGVEEEVAKLQQIQRWEDVISAEMVFSYSEKELEENMKTMNENQELPSWLNDPNANLKDIKYNGDLKGKY